MDALPIVVMAFVTILFFVVVALHPACSTGSPTENRPLAYDPSWPIPEADFRTAENLVRSKLRPKETITRVQVESPDQVTFITRMDVPRGLLYTFERQGARWVFIHRHCWMR